MKVLSYAAAALLALGGVQAQPQEKPKQPGSSQSEQTKKTGGQKKPRRRVVTNLAGFDLLEPSKLEKQTMVVGATRGLPRPVALAPYLGRLYGTHPTFAWSFPGNIYKFDLALYDDKRNELYRKSVIGRELRYPADAPILEPSKIYFWTAEVSGSTFGSEPSEPVGFVVASESQREEVAKLLASQTDGASYDNALRQARLFRDKRLWYDAVDAYSELIAKYAKIADLYEERGMIYAQLQHTQELAEQDFSYADELRRK